MEHPIGLFTSKKMAHSLTSRLKDTFTIPLLAAKPKGRKIKNFNGE